MSARAHAIRLLERHQNEIARAIVRQTTRVAPRTAVSDEETRIRTVENILGAAGDLVGGQSPKRFFGLVADLMTLRSAGGWLPSDFVAASHCYLPVIRRVFVRKDPVNGMEAYNILEEYTLMLIIRLAESMVPAPQDDVHDLDTVSDRKGHDISSVPFDY